MDRASDVSPRPLDTVLRRARDTPWKFGFVALMRRLAAAHAHLPPVGRAGRPQQEAFRLGQAAALTFAPREIAEIVFSEEEPGRAVGVAAPPLQPAPETAPETAQVSGPGPERPRIRVYGLGLLGPNGPLPLHFTEMVRERRENHGDTTLQDFLDLFHHRYLTHLYRAWAQAQAAAGLDRADDESFSRYVARLSGHEPGEISDSVLPSHARLAASSHLSHDARHPDGLAGTLSRFFAVPVEVHEFAMHWIRIDVEDQTQLGQARESGALGVGAIAGEVVPDRQNKFRIVIGPLPLDRYLRFTPRGKDLPQLVEWVRAFIGYEFEWEVELRIRSDSAPPARLDDQQRLGWTTWLGRADESTDVPSASAGPRIDHYSVGMVFEPEAYMPTHMRNVAAPARPAAAAPTHQAVWRSAHDRLS
ncbi:type VI secretion system baseplate subunit TssG [uncultured Pseudacidovorax sp.]|uniref:type VI secretion system baseplate subunit TssG n=1 Tax=uncultured Pseudacidovorax sp. TaxID=679313 RepID=UPI0025E36DDC|nr:type VI secretion system baseplate subunit TssG [uncultured Pseudacidovorax sp.]